MRIKVVPADFLVEERLNVDLAAAGPWAVYRLRKTGQTTLAVQTHLAATLGLPRQRVVFPALKDRVATATQHVSLPAGRPPRLSGEGYVAARVGFLPRPLGPRDLEGNTFAITVRDLGAAEAPRLALALRALGQGGLPNYLGEQRMGSYAPGWGFVGRAILQRDEEEALRAYLARPFLGDPLAVRRFKAEAAALWPDWRAIMAVAPRPSNWRSVLTYLIDHPDGYRKALNLVPARLLALYLAAYQSDLWNALVSRYLAELAPQRVGAWPTLTIAGRRLALPGGTDLDGRRLARLTAPLPNHRAAYPAELRAAAEATLAAEGLQLDDLKARILERAYLSKELRPLWLRPEELAVEAPTDDERFSGRMALRVRLGLPRGSYATLVIRAAAAQAGLAP